MSETLYQCPECELHYRDEAIAKACEAFCSQNHACNMEIAKHAIEKEETS